jgi:hypothetical protein
MNPLGAGVEVREQLQGAPKSRVMIRAYGWAERGENNAFPKFGDPHIISLERWRTLLKSTQGTWYLVSDPGSAGKNWFFQWWYATTHGDHIMAREWPDRQRYEEWAISPAEADATSEQLGHRRHDWRRGPAQRLEAGRSIASYKALVLEEEGWLYDADKKVWRPGPAAIHVHRRLMDPSFGGTEVPSEEEGATPIELLEEKDQRDSAGRTVPPMYWEQAARGSSARASGGFKADRAQLLADWLDYDDSQPLSGANKPRLYIVANCLQTIEAFREYVAPPWSSSKNALCEPIDCAGYYAKSDLRYVDVTAVRVTKGAWW